MFIMLLIVETLVNFHLETDKSSKILVLCLLVGILASVRTKAGIPNWPHPQEFEDRKDNY